MRILWFEDVTGKMRNVDPDMMKPYTQQAFLICAVVLAIAGIAMEWVHVEKLPFPLKKSLDRLDEKGLAPYKVVSKEKIKNEEVLKELGTEDYIQWILEDTDAAADSAVRKCLLFITYYELPDRVPHVPEECYMGTGHQRLSSDSMTFEIKEGGSERKIPGRCLVFESTRSNYWGRSEKFSALYLIKVNKDYTNSRDGARWVLNKNVFSKYVYFCKVEWNFLGSSGAKTYPKIEETLEASKKLLSVILPILEREHWPDWEK